MFYYISAAVLGLIRLLRQDTSDDGIKYHTVTAPADGAEVFIGYADIHVYSPDQGHTVTWTYASEPPFGNSVNHVSLNGEPLPGYYWGRAHIWSPASDYFTLDRRVKNSSYLYVIRVADTTWTKIAEGASAIRFVYPLLEFQHHEDPKLLTKRIDLLDPSVWKKFEAEVG